MDMFGGLTKTSSRIAIAAALGLVVGGFAFKATPARAADLGGDCCADLEERVAELEATTVRKGNKKVSVTLSGWVIKSFNWWDDGDLSSAYVGDKGYDLGSRFAITGSATIAPGWSAGYNLTVNVQGTKFATGGTSLGFPLSGVSNQFGEGGFGPTGLGGFTSYGAISTLYSFIYIKSDKWGTLNWGHLSPASDNKVVLADISGTVIESNSVFFEGASFILRPKGARLGGFGGMDNGLTWGNFLLCQGLGAGLGTDCFGAAQPAVRYDSPTWGGFSFQTSWGKQEALNPSLFDIPSERSNFWDLAVMYTADWNSIKLSAAYTYTWMESAALSGSFTAGACDWPGGFCQGDQDSLHNDHLHQIGGSILHKPSGLGIFGQYTHEDTGGSFSFFSDTHLNPNLSLFTDVVTIKTPETNTWYVKPFWRKTWSPIGATTLFGEYGQYNDQFDAGAGGLCETFDNSFGTNIDAFCNRRQVNLFDREVFVTGSEVQRWGLGVVQEIDSAAMHVYARWQHQDISLDLTGASVVFDSSDNRFESRRQHVGQGFEDWDLFQVGGIIFF
jgi:porin-like protein